MRVRVLLLAVLVLALSPVAASADYPHVVQRGETLTSVAAVDGLSITAIADANQMSPQAQLVAGQILWIPPRTAATAATGRGAAVGSGPIGSASTSTSTAATASSTVSTGATGTATSSAGVTTTSTGAATNGAATASDGDGDRDAHAVTGAQANQGGGGAAAQSGSATGTAQTAVTGQTTTGPTTTTQDSGAAANQMATSVGAAPVPTPERVSAPEIAYIANANGVPAPLAEAIAWQESGWNNAEVSGVGAIGVMQIVPLTWSWIDRYLTPTDPLGTASAAENIRAGVLLLHQLLQLTGGNEQLAVAGYFQGLGSVQAHGMYRSTRQYVADVLALAQRFGG